MVDPEIHNTQDLTSCKLPDRFTLPPPFPSISTFRRHRTNLGSTMYNIVQNSTVQHASVLYSTIQYNTINYSPVKEQYTIVKYNSVQYNTIQYSTVQYNCMQQSAVTEYNKLYLLSV